jgi:hypothetical protein
LKPEIHKDFFLPNTQAKGKKSDPKNSKTRHINMAYITLGEAKPPATYLVSARRSVKSTGSLIDRGANGGICGGDMRVIEMDPLNMINVTGINNHQITGLPIVTCGGVVTTNKGPAIAIFHNYVLAREGNSIHSSGQLESFSNDICDHSLKVGGKQRIKTVGGYIIPLDIYQGLCYMKLHPYRDDEWDTLPHINMTSVTDWDPTCIDCTLTDNSEWMQVIQEVEEAA